MIRSKNITDYFEAKLDDIRPLIQLDFDIYLYLSKNQQLMVLRPNGDSPPTELLEKYKSRGINRIWIYKGDAEAFRLYLSTRTKEGALVSALLNATKITPEEKTVMVSEVAKALFKEVAKPGNRVEQTEANKKLRQTILDVLDKTATRSESAILEVLRLCEIDPELRHSATVAAYCVTFAMAFGKIEGDLLADIALSALLHDIGLSQIPVEITSMPWKSMNEEEKKIYNDHVRLSLKILDENSFAVPERVKTLIHQHHEKFDGSGYPQGLKGYNVNDIAQLISMGNVVDSFANGHWDGQKRTVKDTLTLLAETEKSAKMPEYFNPDLFSEIFRWMSETEADDTLKQVSSTVGKQAEQIIKAA